MNTIAILSTFLTRKLPESTDLNPQILEHNHCFLRPDLVYSYLQYTENTERLSLNTETVGWTQSKVSRSEWRGLCPERQKYDIFMSQII